MHLLITLAESALLTIGLLFVRVQYDFVVMYIYFALPLPQLFLFGYPFQVIIGSFVYLGLKAKNKDESQEVEAGMETEFASTDQSSTPVSNQNANPAPIVMGWPGPRQIENRPGRIDIDLARG
jgi:hypothetical protein